MLLMPRNARKSKDKGYIGTKVLKGGVSLWYFDTKNPDEGIQKVPKDQGTPKVQLKPHIIYVTAINQKNAARKVSKIIKKSIQDAKHQETE